MTQALLESWASSLTVVHPLDTVGNVAGLSRLPAEWQAVDRVVLDDYVIDHVVVGPNGVFSIALDPDTEPATLGDDGLYRRGARVTATVKSALSSAHALRRRVGDQLFAYPMLVTALEGPADHLDRLGVIPAGRIPEAIWSHSGRPLTRSQRVETLWALRSLAV